MKYHVTYFYLATGMEGRADVRDYGIVEAKSAEDARRQIAEREGPDYIDWMMGCLKAVPKE